MGGVGGGWRERPCPPSFPWRTPVSSPAHTPACREHPRETEEGPCVQGPGQSGKQGPRHFSRDHRGPGSRSVPGHCAAIAAASEGHATTPGAQGHPHRIAQGLPSPGWPTWTQPHSCWAVGLTHSPPPPALSALQSCWIQISPSSGAPLATFPSPLPQPLLQVGLASKTFGVHLSSKELGVLLLGAFHIISLETFKGTVTAVYLLLSLELLPAHPGG